MMLFDSHCHLNHPLFREDYRPVWEKARTAGVQYGVVIGYSLESSRNAIAIAHEHEGLYASVGISPHDIQEAPDDYLAQLETLLQDEKVVAVGETGLEYNYDVGPKPLQHERFASQIALANRWRKTVVIHLRDADEDFLRIVADTPPRSAILHCFTATRGVMEEAVERGYGISLSGICTFKNATEIHAVVPHIPAENLLIETDAPYLAPIPYRGKRCEPWMLGETAKKIAQLRDEPEECIAEQTYENAMRLFGLR
jgi:TatD DNase family protein